MKLFLSLDRKSTQTVSKMQLVITAVVQPLERNCVHLLTYIRVVL
jgi:hypothetical protein